MGVLVGAVRYKDCFSGSLEDRSVILAHDTVDIPYLDLNISGGVVGAVTELVPFCFL